jgi:Fe-S-cluster containining protein
MFSILTCDHCGACCLVVPIPPFRRHLDGSGEEAWERLRWEQPELTTELLEADRARRGAGLPDYGTPCLWYDAATRRCRHYEARPRACREFALDGPECHDARRRAGIG